MIREYLGLVSVAATKVLPKGDRLLFVGRTRAAIEARVGPAASADADDVRNALMALGDPEVLAQQERERLYAARRRGAAAAPPALWKPAKESRRSAVPPPPPRRRGPGQARRAWPHRGLTGPEEPLAESASPASPPAPAPAVPRQADSPEATVPPLETAAPGSPGPEGPAPESPAPKTPAPTSTGGVPTAAGPPAGVPSAGEPAADEPAAGLPPAHVPAPGEPAAGHPPASAPPPGEPTPHVPAGTGADQAGPSLNGRDPSLNGGDPGLNGRDPGGAPPGWMRPRPGPPPGETSPLSIVPGMGQPAEEDEPAPAPRRSPVAVVLAEAWALARKHPLEAVATVLLGVGGLILPFPPFWLIGGLVALRSRRWDARDKWIALTGPGLVTLAVLIIRAATSPGNFFPAFYHAAQNDGGASIRAGCVLCAAYLVWRLRRGPRLRTLPPWQRPR